MASTAVTQLQQQIDEVRREAFAAGYATAMQAIRELASRSAPEAGSTTAAPRRRGNSPISCSPAAARYQCAADRGDPAGIGTARHATSRDPQGVAGQGHRDGVRLDPSCACSIGIAQCGRAGRRQQDLASPRRRILNALQAVKPLTQPSLKPVERLAAARRPVSAAK